MVKQHITKKVIATYLLFAITASHAATVSMTAFYGRTGGIKGDLNQVGDEVNGNIICPVANDYNNIAPGCDMGGEAEFNIGDPTNPNDDKYTGDLIVRTHDVFEVIAGYNWTGVAGGAEEQVTITGVLPSGIGFVWDTLPALCDADSSSISNDKKTITCTRKDFDLNDTGSYSENFSLFARVDGATPNGSTPGDITITIDAPNATSVTDNTEKEFGDLIKVTAAPRWNLRKSHLYQPQEIIEINGNKGYIINYLFYIEVNGYDTGINPLIGNEPLEGDINTTITFTDDLSTISPNVTLYAGGLSGPQNACTLDEYSQKQFDPSPAYTSVPNRSSIPAMTGTRTIACQRNGNKVDITITGVDTTLNKAPTHDKDGNLLDADHKLAAIASMRVFIPLNDIPVGTTITTKNYVTHFNPLGISGTSNFGTSSESESDNYEIIELSNTTPDPILYLITNKYFVNGWSDNPKEASNWNNKKWYYPLGGKLGKKGDATIGSNALFGASISVKSSSYSDTDAHNVILCDVIDVNTYTMEIINPNEDYPETVLDERLHAVDINGFGSGDIQRSIQYSTGYVGNWPPNPFENATEDLNRECGDPSIVWYNDMPSALASGQPVTKFRMITPILAAKKDINARVKLKARKTFLDTGKPIPNGTLLVNYFTVKSDEKINDDWPAGTWKSNNYQPQDASLPPYGFDGDRLIFTQGQVRIKKEMTPSAVTIGEQSTVSLTPSFTIKSPDIYTGKFVVIDVLPNGLDYITGSTKGGYGTPITSYPEPDIIIKSPTDEQCKALASNIILEDLPCGTLNGGTGKESIIGWTFNDQTTGTIYNPIKFNVLVTAGAADETIKNHAQISSDSDKTRSKLLVSNANIVNSVPQSLLISKTAMTPIASPDTNTLTDWMKYRIALRNGSTQDTLSNLDIIDILPFNGDNQMGSFSFTPLAGNTIERNRSPGTSYDGVLEFSSMVFDNNDSQCSGDIEYWYTSTKEKLDISPVHPSNEINSGSAGWCQGSETAPNQSCPFTKQKITAIRVRGANMTPSATCYLNITYATENASKGNTYANTAAAKATGVANAVLSNTVSAQILDDNNALSGNVFIDLNQNNIIDADDTVLPNICISINDGTQTFSTLTDNNGSYAFKTDVMVYLNESCDGTAEVFGSLATGVFSVTQQSSAPNGYTAGNIYAGTVNNNIVGTVNTNNRSIEAIVLNQNQSAINYNFTFNQTLAASISLAKSAIISIDNGMPNSADIGDTITYSYTVTNTGAAEIANIVVSDTHNAKGQLSAINCPSTVLVAAEAMTCSATYLVIQEDIDSGLSSIDNTAVAVGTDPAGNETNKPTASASVPLSVGIDKPREVPSTNPLVLLMLLMTMTILVTKRWQHY